jgi:hypothetical protein
MLLVFAVGILADVVRRYIYGSEPIGSDMMVMSAIAGWSIMSASDCFRNLTPPTSICVQPQPSASTISSRTAEYWSPAAWSFG